MPLRAVLFDWDGTLLDSAESTYRSYVAVFSSFGIPFDREAFQRTYAPNWYVTYEAIALPRQHWDDADSRWMQHYHSQASVLLPGARETLARLGQAGFVLGVVTSGDRTRVTGEIARLGLVDAFRTVVCRGDTPHAKPHPEPLQRALGEIGVAPEETAFVGDSPEDVKMARAAGARSVAIPGGFPNHDALRATEADVWAEDLAEAADVLLTRRDQI